MNLISLLFLPLLNTLLIALFAHRLGVLGINCIIVFCFCLNTFLALYNFIYIFITQQIIFINIGSWFTLNNINIYWEFQNTLITSLLSLIIISISALIHVYSIYYMDNDNSYQKFIMLLSLFTFFMLFLIFSSQLITILIGWEAVGICSYLLINFWAVRQEANQSAIKAVLFNKIGDLGFILAILIALLILVDTDLINLNKLIINFSNISFYHFNILQILGYSLVLAAFGKSAQFFFHLWLTDAMEGPTPVSGLIHSATMVIAGVFLIIQTFTIIKLSAELLLIIILVGTVTTLITSLVATTSFDIKRIIANSTASHIGLMFMSLGLGDLSVSLFHLTTHAYFKAFGFLFAGYLIHLLMNEQDCRLMGGIFNLFPIVSILEEYWCITMLNLPNSSSYYSKELFFNTYWAYSNIILSSFFIYSSFLMCFLSFICSSLYIAYLLSWFGDKTTIIKANLNHLYEFKWVPLTVLIVLALLSQTLGFLLYNLFLSSNAFYTFQEFSLFFFIADWNEFYLLYSSVLIIFITCLIDFTEDSTLHLSKLIIKSTTVNFKYFKLIVMFLILVVLLKFNSILFNIIIILISSFLFFRNTYSYYYIQQHLTFKWTPLIKRITSFSLDSLFNFSLYSSLTKGLSLFYSIDNYLVETANHLGIYKRISFYLQSFPLNNFVTQLNINFVLILLVFFYINYSLF